VHYWLGGTDVQTEGTWVWAPSSAAVSYTDWAPDQPDSAQMDFEEDCMEMAGEYNYKWNDYSCDKTGFSICEKP
jgi:hypothetical protein